MKCCKCKRDARTKINGFDWMCTQHANQVIRQLRIERKLEHAKQRMEQK